MTQIIDIVELFNSADDTEVEIFDVAKNDTEWKGRATEIPDKYMYEECLCIESGNPTKNYNDTFILSVRLE